MPKIGNPRTRAEQHFDRAAKTTAEAKSVLDTELDATRKKTAGLRKLRLAKEAAAGITPIEMKPRAKRT